jgi:biopolymer transport protein ExbD
VSRRRKRGEVEEKADIDLTPMLDVVFIMLIFFIVTASFVKEAGLGVQIPDVPENPPPTNPDDPKNIVISVTASNEIMMEGRRVDARSVRSNMERMKAENPAAIVIVQADVKSEAATYISIAEAARAAKISQVSLVPKGGK